MKGICRGAILHRMFETTIPPKPKFFVVIGESETHIIGYFFINSNINNYIRRETDVYNLQMPCKRSEYPFLSYDSFIAAHELNVLDKSLLSEELTSGKTSIKGCLNTEDMTRLIEAAKTSDLFSPYEKDTYFK